jgi:hypothetical protein
MVLVLFALNRSYPVNDKTALAEVAEFQCAPREFSARVQKALLHIGTSPAELLASVEAITQLHRETVELAEGLYQPRFTLPN